MSFVLAAILVLVGIIILRHAWFKLQAQVLIAETESVLNEQFNS